MLLADLGAEVVKVERPGRRRRHPALGSAVRRRRQARPTSRSVNRNKRSVALDLGTADGLARGARRSRCAPTCVVENFKPGALDRLGLGYAELSAENPRLVLCSISGFGSGAGAELPGYDLLVQAMGGLMSVTGPGAGAPHEGRRRARRRGHRAARGLRDPRRAAPPRPHRARASTSRSTCCPRCSPRWSTRASAYVAAGVVPGILGNDHPSITPYGVYATGRPAAGARGGQRRPVPRAGRRPRRRPRSPTTRASRPTRRGSRTATSCATSLEAALRTRGADHWYAALTAAGVPCGPDQRPRRRRSTSRRGSASTRSCAVPGSTVPQVANPLRMSATPPRYRTAPPALGSTSPDDLAGLLP